MLLCVVDRVLVECRDRLRELELIVQSRRVNHAGLRDLEGELRVNVGERDVRGGQ